MKKSLLCRVAAIAFSAIVVLFSSQFALADTISLSVPTGFVAPVVTSDGDTGSITIDDFVVTNTTTTKFKVGAVNQYIFDFTDITATISGHQNNPLDLITGYSITTGSNPSLSCMDSSSSYVELAEGQSCTFDLMLTYQAGAPYPGHMNPFGSDKIVVSVAGYNPNGTEGNTAKDNVNFRATVDYAAPEPNSLILFGTGMLGLAGVLRRKLGRG